MVEMDISHLVEMDNISHTAIDFRSMKIGDPVRNDHQSKEFFVTMHCRRLGPRNEILRSLANEFALVAN